MHTLHSAFHSAAIGLSASAVILIGSVIALGAVIPEAAAFALVLPITISALGCVSGLCENQQPDLDKAQLKKYKAYLDDFEKSHSVKAPAVQTEVSKTNWREHAGKSRNTTTEITR